MKYYIRTTGERKLDSSYSQIEYELLIDSGHKPVESFIEQLKFISGDSAVLLEDDLILCKDFKNRIEEVIRQYPDKIINFFTLPDIYIENCITISNRFAYNQCTYYPKGIAKQIALEMEKIKNNSIKNYQYDVLEGKALNNLGLTHLQYRPCLVQHVDNSSLIQTNNKKRRSPFFIDYLEELGIIYEEAWKNYNTKLLKKIMKEKFKEIDEL